MDASIYTQNKYRVEPITALASAHGGDRLSTAGTSS